MASLTSLCRSTEQKLMLVTVLRVSVVVHTTFDESCSSRLAYVPFRFSIAKTGTTRDERSSQKDETEQRKKLQLRYPALSSLRVEFMAGVSSMCRFEDGEWNVVVFARKKRLSS